MHAQQHARGRSYANASLPSSRQRVKNLADLAHLEQSRAESQVVSEFHYSKCTTKHPSPFQLSRTS
ncbi:hypothetical protein FOTG_16989 [Fusarium oxysporum f. sp. vasinfectum 25433]|uniref:Uncharacterized protein n=1 Tax=Fusarium oxysporum f. sp. vasinfectum 25433 TaxID=1089449 RepID=X0M1Q3_FUSOX|nr:hypothetical protein FOTG_16989 [Fusarium oxysporum f. sp. vasinfectum 25433]